MSPSDPVHVDVYTTSEDVPEALETRNWLGIHRIPYTITDLDRWARATFRRQGYEGLPVVVVWLGDGPRRVRYLTWDGHKPPMLELVERLHEASKAEEATT